MARARLEGGANSPERIAARTLDDAVELFKQHFPDEWDAFQNAPLQHAIPHLIAKLRSVKE